MLLIDAGNSRCKWVWIEAGRWQRQGVLDNTDAAAWQELEAIFLSLPSPHRILISNVAGATMAQRLRGLCAAWQCLPEFVVAQAAQCGVHNGYELATQLGSDRWAALIAAWHKVQGACLVVNCGTATTVDALSDTGKFLGGVILPGIDLMQRSLLDNTAQLGMEKGVLLDFPCNTADAIVTGTMHATLGAIQHQYMLLTRQYKVRCLFSGGAAGTLLPHLDIEAEQVDDLVLQGMQLIGQEGSTKTIKETVA